VKININIFSAKLQTTPTANCWKGYEIKQRYAEQAFVKRNSVLMKCRYRSLRTPYVRPVEASDLRPGCGCFPFHDHSI